MVMIQGLGATIKFNLPSCMACDKAIEGTMIDTVMGMKLCPVCMDLLRSNMLDGIKSRLEPGLDLNPILPGPNHFVLPRGVSYDPDTDKLKPSANKGGGNRTFLIDLIVCCVAYFATLGCCWFVHYVVCPLVVSVLKSLGISQ